MSEKMIEEVAQQAYEFAHRGKTHMTWAELPHKWGKKAYLDFARQIDQFYSKALDDKELREKAQKLKGMIKGITATSADRDKWAEMFEIIDQILALPQQKIEEAKARTFNGTLIFHIPDRKTLEEVGEWAECQDIGTFVYFTKEQWQALSGKGGKG